MKDFHYQYTKNTVSIEMEQYIYRLGTYHYNWHRDLEFFLILNGKAEVCTGGISRMMNENDLILINANEGHTTLAADSDTIAMVIHLDPIFLKEYYDDVEYLSFSLCSIDHPEKSEIFRRIRRNMAQMMLSGDSALPEKHLMFERSFYDLIFTVISEFPPARIRSAAFKTNMKNMDSIQKMVKYINKNYHKKISLDSLARESGYNPSYVSQLFKSCLGINFYDYLTRIRLREATRALSQSDRKILDIALENGFSDLKAFNTSFRETFRKSPTEYRKMLNMENRGNDPFFKTSFLSADDPLVVKKLQEYCEESISKNYSSEEDEKKVNQKFEDHISWLENLASELLREAEQLKDPER